MLRHFIVTVPLLLGTAAMAGPVAVKSDHDIQKTVTTGIFEAKTPLGTRLPIRFKRDGTVSGKASGTMAFLLGAGEDHGRWWTSRGRLCKKWTKWFEGKLQCIRLTRDGNRIHWRRDDGEEGTARLIPDPATPKPVIVADKTAPATPAAAPVKAPKKVALAEKPKVAAKAKPQRDERYRFSPIRNRAKTATPHSAPPTDTSKIVTASVLKTPPKPAARPVAPARGQYTPRRPDVERFFRVSGVRSDDVLNIRRGPSNETSIIGRISYNSRGVRLAGPCRGEWCFVSYRGVKGWVNHYYLAEDRTVRASAWPATFGRKTSGTN